jgi:hypothetical protein
MACLMYMAIALERAYLSNKFGSVEWADAIMNNHYKAMQNCNLHKTSVYTEAPVLRNMI